MTWLLDTLGWVGMFRDADQTFGRGVRARMRHVTGRFGFRLWLVPRQLPQGALTVRSVPLAVTRLVTVFHIL
jgi:hypothetical protein